ncbi:MAG: YtxH domain-containing protein, partial [Polyangiales bacterium]
FPMLAGVGAGMAIGAGLAFFLTPYRGSELREKVVRGASDAKGYLETQAGKISEKVMGSDTTASRSMNTGIGSGSRGY